VCPLIPSPTSCPFHLYRHPVLPFPLQLSGVISPQIFRSKFAPRYTTPYIISIVFLVLSVLSTLWAWYLSKDVERETRRVAEVRYREGKDKGTLSTVEIKAKAGQ
jgi:hypothetical protein